MENYFKRRQFVKICGVKLLTVMVVSAPTKILKPNEFAGVGIKLKSTTSCRKRLGDWTWLRTCDVCVERTINLWHWKYWEVPLQIPGDRWCRKCGVDHFPVNEIIWYMHCSIMHTWFDANSAPSNILRQWTHLPLALLFEAYWVRVNPRSAHCSLAAIRLLCYLLQTRIDKAELVTKTYI